MMNKKESAVMRALASALQDFIHDEVAIEQSGDHGSYDVEELAAVINGRAALADFDALVTGNSPVRLAHKKFFDAVVQGLRAIGSNEDPEVAAKRMWDSPKLEFRKLYHAEVTLNDNPHYHGANPQDIVNTMRRMKGGA